MRLRSQKQRRMYVERLKENRMDLVDLIVFYGASLFNFFSEDQKWLKHNVD